MSEIIVFNRKTLKIYQMFLVVFIVSYIILYRGRYFTIFVMNSRYLYLNRHIYKWIVVLFLSKIIKNNENNNQFFFFCVNERKNKRKLESKIISRRGFVIISRLAFVLFHMYESWIFSYMRSLHNYDKATISTGIKVIEKVSLFWEIIYKLIMNLKK